MKIFKLGGSNQQHRRPQVPPNQPRRFASATRHAILSGLLLGAFFCFGFSQLQAQDRLTLSPNVISFGSVPVGDTNTQTIQVKNSGTWNYTISTISMAVSSRGIFSVSGIKFPFLLVAGRTTTFNVAFAPKTAGAVFAGSVWIQGNFPTITVQASGTGISGTRVISASAKSEMFGNVNVGSSATAAVNLTDIGNLSVTISSVSYTGTGVSASGVANVTLNPGQSTPVMLKFEPTKVGSVTGSVAVTSNANDSPFTIAVSGSGVAAATHSVGLRWTASTSSGVVGYYVYRSTVSGGPYNKLDSGLVTALDYTDSDVQSGAYYYVVKSVVSSGVESAYSSQISVAIP